MGFISLIALMCVGKRRKALTLPNNWNLTEFKWITCVTVFYHDHVKYFPNLMFMFVWSVIASMSISNMFQSISLWCHSHKNMSNLFVKHLDMYQSLKYAKRHMYKIVLPFLDKLWPDTFEASTIVYSWL